MFAFVNVIMLAVGKLFAIAIGNRSIFSVFNAKHQLLTQIAKRRKARNWRQTQQPRHSNDTSVEERVPETEQVSSEVQNDSTHVANIPTNASDTNQGNPESETFLPGEEAVASEGEDSEPVCEIPLSEKPVGVEI